MASPQTEEKKKNGGYIYLARQILDSDIFLGKPAEWLKIWVYILLKVQYCNGRRSPRGTGYFSWRKEHGNLPGVTKWQWHNCLRYLRGQRMVATQKTTRGNLIKVLQYNTYQNPKTYKSKTRSNDRATHEQHTSNTLAKIASIHQQSQGSKEVKEVKEVKKVKDTHVELSKNTTQLFSFWKEHLNHPKAILTKDRRSKVGARLKEGYTIEQGKKAIMGCKSSSYHMGDNPQGRVYDSIELIFRNGDKIEQFISIYEEVQKHGNGKDKRSGKTGSREGWQESDKYRSLYSRPGGATGEAAGPDKGEHH